MSRVAPVEDMFTKPLLGAYDSRDEHFLIAVPGIWYPECEKIFYGLLNSTRSDELPELRDFTLSTPRDVYMDYAFFTSTDMVKKLAVKPVTDEYCEEMKMLAHDTYLYTPCGETMIRHAIIEAAYQKFIKSITLVFDHPIRNIDIKYTASIIPNAIIDKIKLVHGDILDLVKEAASENKSYTTIILNSLEDVITMAKSPIEYNVLFTTFLLRNHSENVEIEFSEDPTADPPITFNEVGTGEVLKLMIDIDTGLPKSGMRFGRFEPILFMDANPDLSNDYFI